MLFPIIIVHKIAKKINESKKIIQLKNNLYMEGENLNIKEMDIKALAYIGDAVYELYIRKHILDHFKEHVNKLHKKAITYVSAKAQAQIMEYIKGELTVEEQDIFRRGRNADANTIPKHTDVITYKIATGFESLIGYLYIIKDTNRLEYLLAKSIEIIER